MNKIFLFTDYRNQFYSSTKYRGASVDLKRLYEFLKVEGFDLVVIPFSEIDFRTQNYRDKWVLYQTSEDPGLFYKSFIEDSVMGLFMQGAKLIPNIFQFKAHHNKNYMEIMRDIHALPEIHNIKTYRYGTYEDYLKNIDSHSSGTYVFKGSDTSKSKDVFLLDSAKKKINIPRKVSKTFSLRNLQYFIERLRTGKKPLPISNNRKKFILQNYISELSGDYRIVVYGDKFYVLYRNNRPNDFRASGSMNFNYDITPPEGILDFSKKVFESFNVPYIALDIGFKDGIFYLLEFQFLSFGQYTLEKSEFYYKQEKGEWNKVLEKPDLEREIATSVSSFIKNYK